MPQNSVFLCPKCSCTEEKSIGVCKGCGWTFHETVDDTFWDDETTETDIKRLSTGDILKEDIDGEESDDKDET